MPALVACALRPALINAGVNALLGSTVLLLAAVPCVVLGDHGEAAAVLIVALTVSVASSRTNTGEQLRPCSRHSRW